jgi:spore germination cell wall hydrolase CwlJ-like protein
MVTLIRKAAAITVAFGLVLGGCATIPLTTTYQTTNLADEVTVNPFDEENAQVLDLDLPFDQMYPEHDENTKFKYSEADIDLVARVVWGESRQQPIKGQEWVVHVIINRLLKGDWGGSIKDVVTFKVGRYHAFSALNRFDPNYRKLMAVTEDDEDFVIAKEVTRRVIEGRANQILADASKGSLYYHATYVWPRWAAKRNQTAKIGAHIFYFAAAERRETRSRRKRYS